MPFDHLKGLVFPINKFLLKQKNYLFPVRLPYSSLISTQIISYQQLAIIHAGVTVCSILGSIFIGSIILLTLI